MKTLSRLTLSSLFLIPSVAFAHLIEYDSKPFLEIAKDNPEKAAYIAHFCYLAADSVDDCFSRLLIAKGEEAAEKCGREIQEISREFHKEFHMAGEVPGHPELGYPHIETIRTKSEGCHSYGHTDSARWMAGMEEGTKAVSWARAQAVKQQEIENKAKETTGTIEGFLKIFGEIFRSGAEASVKASGEVKDTASKSVIKGGLDQYDIAKAFNAGFKKGWENPWKAIKSAPDIYFPNGKTEAIGADGKKYKLNPSQLVPPIPKEYLKDEGPVSVEKNKEEDPTTKNPSPEPSNKGASLDASTSSDGTWAQIQPAQSGDLTPIQQCYEMEMTQIKKKEMIQTVEGEELTFAQRKERAEALMEMGMCDESFFGADFCRDWKQKQGFHVDESMNTPSGKQEEQSFDEFATIEQPEPKDPFALFEGSDPLGAIPSNDCYPLCPIEGQPF